MSGRRKGGKGLGEGGAKRHRKVPILDDDIQGPTKTEIRRLARCGGVKRINIPRGVIFRNSLFNKDITPDAKMILSAAKKNEWYNVDKLLNVFCLKKQAQKNSRDELDSNSSK